MEANKQEKPTGEILKENEAVQLVQPQAILDEMAELEKMYCETVERESR